MPYENLVFPPYPENWKNLSWFIRRRDNNECIECGSRKKPLHVHHVIPLSKGGNNHPDNLQTLCKSCHAEKHPHMLYELQQRQAQTITIQKVIQKPPAKIQFSTTEIIILWLLTMITLATCEILFIIFLIFMR